MSNVEQNKEVIKTDVMESELPKYDTGNIADVTLNPEGLNPHTHTGGNRQNMFATEVLPGLEPTRREINTMERYSETMLAEQAATDAHPEVENVSAIKERVEEVTKVDQTFAGTSHKIAEDLWWSVSVEMQTAVSKLNRVKSIEDRIVLVDHIALLNRKLGALVTTFLA